MKRYTILTIAIAAIIIATAINPGTSRATAQAVTATTQTANPTPTPVVTIETPIITHGNPSQFPPDGAQFLVVDDHGHAITRTMEVLPASWTGWSGVEILNMRANSGTFFTPEMVGGYNVTDPATGERLYDPKVISVRGHGSLVKIRTKRCVKLMGWDFNLFMAGNHVYHEPAWDYVDVIAYLKNDDGTESETVIGRLEWRGSGSVVLTNVNPHVQFYAGDRFAGNPVGQGHVFSTQRTPATQGQGWMMWPGLIGASLSMREGSPFNKCIGLGVNVVNQAGYGTQWVSLLDIVEKRMGNTRRGTSLHGNVTGEFPTGEVCGPDACAEPPICEKTIEWRHPSQAQTCGTCVFPVWVNPTGQPVFSNSNPAKIALGWVNSSNPMLKLTAFYTASFYSRQRADCNNMMWEVIRRGALDCYGVVIPDEHRAAVADVKTIGDLFDATVMALTQNVSDERRAALIAVWEDLAPRR